MIIEYNTGKSIEDLYRCDYCQYTGKPKPNEKLYCSKLYRDVINNKTKCKYNKIQNYRED